MDKLLVRGGKTLQGTVQISGAKNAALPATCIRWTVCTGAWMNMVTIRQTIRSEMSELLHRLKYQGDALVIGWPVDSNLSPKHWQV